MPIDSGAVFNDSTDPAMSDVATPVWSQVVAASGAPWVRLRYDGVRLTSDVDGDRGSFLRLTSLTDGAVQTQHAVHVAQWQNTSAYMNGDSVLVELFAYPGTGANRFALAEVEFGLAPFGEDSICGDTDDRGLSTDPRASRNQPGGCTSWMIDDCNHGFLTAGHCERSLEIIEFNVPLSLSNGVIQHPSPSDQYVVDPQSVQTTGTNSSVGDDWTYFGVFANSTTGLIPFEAQGQVCYQLASSLPAIAGQPIRITGYGSTTSPVSPTWYLTQKTHAGPFTAIDNPTTLRYQADTTGGNSGSAVLDESAGLAIGIHTHAGCDPEDPLSANRGTAITNPGLQAALANPAGVCRCSGPSFSYPNGLPTRIAPDGSTTVCVQLTTHAGVTPVSGTGQLHVDTGSGFLLVPMQEVTPDVYDVAFPAASCPSQAAFYFSVQGSDGQQHTDPFDGPSAPYSRVVASGEATVIEYDFEVAPPGWTASGAFTTGTWNRGIPNANGGTRRDPPADFDGSGRCWVTGNSFNEDIDGGTPTLTTETFDLSATTDPFVSYARWFLTNSSVDTITVEVSQNGGGSWTTLENLSGAQASWWVVRFRLLDHVTNLSEIRFRFSAGDIGEPSVTEAGLDAFRIFDLDCTATATWTEFGTGCAGTLGVPALSSSDLPRLGQPFDSSVQNVPAAANAFGVLGFSDTDFGGLGLPVDLGAIGMTGCTLYTSIETSTQLTQAASVATWTLLIPNDAGLLGLRFYQQAILADPGANPLGATASNAGSGTIGI